MNLRQCIFTNNDCYKRGVRIKAKGIMVHSTGADNPYLRRYLGPDDGLIGKNAYNNHWNMPNVPKCVHAMIGLDINDEVQVYQTLPWDYRSWHCGAEGNDQYISFEICEDDLQDREYWLKTKNAAVELCAYLCKENGWNPLEAGVLIDHITGWEMGIASGHTDIRHWWSRFGYTLDDFRMEVNAAMHDIPDMEQLIKKAVADYIEGNITTIAKSVAAEMPAEKVYDTFESLPNWAKAELKPLIDAGVIKGNGKKLDLTMPVIRVLAILWRLIGTGEVAYK